MAKKMPPTKFPDAASVQYARRLRKIVKEMHDVTKMLFEKRIKEAIKEYKKDVKTDSYRVDDPLDVIRKAIKLLKSLTLGVVEDKDTEKLSKEFVNDIDRLSGKNVEQQVRVKGIDPARSEPWLDSFKETAIEENVSLIKDIQREYAKSVEVIINHGTRTGKSLKDIQTDIQRRLKITENRAKLIARDQTGSIFGQMTAKRHKEAGILKFRWSTSSDEKVRDKHRDLDGKEFTYKKPPSEGLPGEPIQCRCVAIPIFDDDDKEDEDE